MLILLTGFKPLSTPMLTRKELLLQHTNRNDIIMRKLKITELNRISIEEFKEADKLPLVVVLDDIRSLHNIGSVFRTADAFRIECIYLCGITATPPHPEMHRQLWEPSLQWIGSMLITQLKRLITSGVKDMWYTLSNRRKGVSCWMS